MVTLLSSGHLVVKQSSSGQVVTLWASGHFIVKWSLSLDGQVTQSPTLSGQVFDRCFVQVLTKTLFYIRGLIDKFRTW